MSTFTQKHYRKIAKWIAELPEDKNLRLKFAKYLANKLEQDNPKFKKEMFFSACGFVKSDLRRNDGEVY